MQPTETITKPVMGKAYKCFTLDMDEEQAAQKFKAKYGKPPETIIEYMNQLWVGPIPEHTK